MLRPVPFVSACLLLLTACASISTHSDDVVTASSLREFIDQNRHFSLHCFCRATTFETVEAVRQRVGADPGRIGVLIELLDDDQYTLCAEASLVVIGEPAGLALRAAISSGAVPHRGRLEWALKMVESSMAPVSRP